MQILVQLYDELHRDVPREPIVRGYVADMIGYGWRPEDVAVASHPDHGETPLDMIDLKGHYKYAKMFVEEFELDPQELLVSRENIVRLGLTSGADPDLLPPPMASVGSSGCPLHFIDNVKTARILLAFGADPKIRDDKGLTPFMKHVVRGNYNIAEALLPHTYLEDRVGGYPHTDYGPETNPTIVEEISSLDRRVYEKSNSVGWLLRRGAKPTGRALAEAVVRRKSNVIHELLDFGAPIPEALDLLKKRQLDKYSDEWVKYLEDRLRRLRV